MAFGPAVKLSTALSGTPTVLSIGNGEIAHCGIPRAPCQMACFEIPGPDHLSRAAAPPVAS